VLINYLGSNYGNLIYAINYHDYNSSHFEENVNRIGNFITDMVNTAKQDFTKLGVTKPKPIVIKKADVVAHSMGGILASLYITSNTYRSDVNRLISVGTPFSGSQLSNYVLYFLFEIIPEPYRTVYLQALEVALQKIGASGNPIVGGAVEDLQVGSQAINQFIIKLGSYSFPVPVYAITCDGDTNTPGLGLDFVYWCLSYWDIYFAFGTYFGTANIENTMFGTNDTDFVVAFESQRGGSSKSIPKYVIDHMNETGDTDVKEGVESIPFSVEIL
jgi:pimeloyl-ACP methyl ester carboxylesterase